MAKRFFSASPMLQVARLLAGKKRNVREMKKKERGQYSTEMASRVWKCLHRKHN